MKNYSRKKNESEIASVQVAAVAADFTLTGFSKLSDEEKTARWRIVADNQILEHWNILNCEKEHRFLNSLTVSHWSSSCLEWLRSDKCSVKYTQLGRGKEFILKTEDESIAGSYRPSLLSAAGVGAAPHESLFSESVEMTLEQARHQLEIFDAVWSDSEKLNPNDTLENQLQFLASPHPAEWVYMKACQIFVSDADTDDEFLDDPPGYTETKIWQELYDFQKDGVKGAINKILKYNGCVLADSVGLGKTYEALAVIKYFARRGDKVLVLAPKRLRGNWSVFTSNDDRNPFVEDPFHYTLLNHTDIGRLEGRAGDVDLAHFRWENFDLIVIDESHNFRNHKGSRYQYLLDEIIRKGAKTKLLLLTATPVNNRVADLRNQINLIAHGKDDYLKSHGVDSVMETTTRAQRNFAEWARTPEEERVNTSLLRVLGQDYIHLLDMLTIARSRRHIEAHYNAENRFPTRRKPVNCYPSAGEEGFLPVVKISAILGELSMALYSPLRYVLQEFRDEYAQYNQQLGINGQFSQLDREVSLTALMTVNLLKRMESSVEAFSITLHRQMEGTENLLRKLRQHHELELTDGLDVEDAQDEDAEYVGSAKVRISINHVDVRRWSDDLQDDLKKLREIDTHIQKIVQSSDSKMSHLRKLIQEKIQNPINPGNKKVLIFTAFADTAEYIYREIAPWLLKEHGLYSAKVTGSRANEVNLPGLRTDQDTILSAFSPRSKQFDPGGRSGGRQIDILVATDCVSEGQNLQDCDYLVNFDIHWNPVRLIQRFGRVDRIGSTNKEIQMVNMWPIVELNTYINLEQRVKDKMGLLDANATGHDNLLDAQADGQKLDFRARQLLRLRDEVISMEDVAGNAALTDLNFQQHRGDLQTFRSGVAENCPERWPSYLGAVSAASAGVPAGAFFLLKSYASIDSDKSYPYAPYYLIHVAEDGTVNKSFRDVKEMLALLQQATRGRQSVVPAEQEVYDKLTRKGKEMTRYTNLLSSAVRELMGEEQQSVARSLFSPGKSQIGRGRTARGVDDVEVLAWLAVLP